jgi:hypothetical protein
MMLEWGCQLADLLFLPAWVEASPEGSLMYERHGFYTHELIEGDLTGPCMKRDARKTPIMGGKAK